MSQQEQYHEVNIGGHRVVRVRKAPPHYAAERTARENLAWATTTEEAFEMAYLIE